VRPRALLGHSVGEFVAACLAGVFSLEDGLRLVARRAEMMQAQPPGGMLSVRLPVEQVRPCSTPPAPSPRSTGRPCASWRAGRIPGADRGKFADREQVVYRALRTAHAFHSPMMDAVVAPFLEAVRAVKRSPPRLPILSTVTRGLADAGTGDRPGVLGPATCGRRCVSPTRSRRWSRN